MQVDKEVSCCALAMLSYDWGVIHQQRSFPRLDQRSSQTSILGSLRFFDRTQLLASQAQLVWCLSAELPFSRGNKQIMGRTLLCCYLQRVPSRGHSDPWSLVCMEKQVWCSWRYERVSFHDVFQERSYKRASTSKRSTGRFQVEPP